MIQARYPQQIPDTILPGKSGSCHAGYAQYYADHVGDLIRSKKHEGIGDIFWLSQAARNPFLRKIVANAPDYKGGIL